jgi:SAM-dependent methyltransferase
MHDTRSELTRGSSSSSNRIQQTQASTIRALARGLVVLLCVVLAALGTYAQQPSEPKKPYEPQVGQKGKDVVWVPTSDALVEKMLELGQVSPRDYVIDLGSGDGRLVIAAARRGARALGIEYNPDMVALAQRHAVKAGVAHRATFLKADLFTIDLSRATVITMFLLPEINLKLRPKLLGLKPGTRIVSNSFSMEEWHADGTAMVGGDDCTSWCTALLWIVPAKVQGSWHLAQGDLVIEQRFQMISGTLGSAPITGGRLRGNEISFAVGQARYSGKVKGNSISGIVVNGTSSSAWAATRSATRHSSRSAA